MDTFADRIAALDTVTHRGLDDNRGLADALADARLFFWRGEVSSGAHHLLLAEWRGSSSMQTASPRTIRPGLPGWASARVFRPGE